MNDVGVFRVFPARVGSTLKIDFTRDQTLWRYDVVGRRTCTVRRQMEAARSGRSALLHENDVRGGGDSTGPSFGRLLRRGRNRRCRRLELAPPSVTLVIESLPSTRCVSKVGQGKYRLLEFLPGYNGPVRSIHVLLSIKRPLTII